MKYTVIWEDRWKTGSHWQYFTKKTFVIVDDIKKIFDKYPGTVYIFEGHIPTLGEDLETSKIVTIV